MKNKMRVIMSLGFMLVAIFTMTFLNYENVNAQTKKNWITNKKYAMWYFRDTDNTGIPGNVENGKIAYNLNIENIADDGKITFSIEYIGLNYSPLVISDPIEGVIKGNKVDFNWTDSAGCSGTGVLKFKKNGRLKLKMIETNRGDWDRASLGQNSEFVTMRSYKSLPKAIKVESECDYTEFDDTYYEQMYIYGKNKDDVTIWSYVTESYVVAQLDNTACFVKKKKVFIFDGSTLVILNKKNGKEIARVDDVPTGSIFTTFDKKGNIYVVGAWGTVVYKISPKGKVLWKSDFSATGNYWPGKIKVKNGKVRITCTGEVKEGEKNIVVLSQKTGRIIN